MRAFASIGLSMALLLGGQVAGQDKTPLPGADVPSTANSQRVTLGRPEPMLPSDLTKQAPPAAPGTTPRKSVRVGLQRPQPIVRAQAPPPPPPPPVSPFGGPAPAAGPAPGLGNEAYNCGVVNDNADLGFFSRCGQNFRRCYEDVSGSFDNMFKGDVNRKPFQSDRCFPGMISPVSNPFYAEDPRSLTELKPIFMWQHTHDSNPIFAGGDNFVAALQGRLALTERVSIVVHKLGFIWTEPENPMNVPGYENHFGLTELHIGPKFTFIRNDSSNTVAAVGLAFEIPIGPAKVYQDTGTLSLRPYFSIAQNFGKTSYGSFNVMNTTGYALGVDNDRTDQIFSQLHLDYNVGNLDRFFPLIELNWAHYPFNGGARSLNFEGRDLFNFGANQAAGKDDLTLALGGRVKINDFWQFGLAAEVGLLGASRHLDGFRITADMIFRY